MIVLDHFDDSEVYSVGDVIKIAQLGDGYCKAGTKNLKNQICNERYWFVQGDKDGAEDI